jgi:hypothetical protein
MNVVKRACNEVLINLDDFFDATISRKQAAHILVTKLLVIIGPKRIDIYLVAFFAPRTQKLVWSGPNFAPLCEAWAPWYTRSYIESERLSLIDCVIARVMEDI